MQIRIHDPAQIGEIVRATRKAEHMRQDVTASAIGVSENFLGKVERGNSSVYWHKLFHVLSRPCKILNHPESATSRQRGRPRPPDRY